MSPLSRPLCEKALNTLEILAPAGSLESLIAAVRSGADAVYLGLSALNARQSAQNFTPDALKEAVDYCHLFGVKVYVTINTLLFDEEIPLLKQLLSCVCAACVDGVIVQDLAVALLVRQCCDTLVLHASTQMTVHSVAGLAQCKSFGMRRVVLARELSLKELEHLVRKAKEMGLETELFVHGALCMSVSGQCYMSALIGTRSGNKGSCAGTCRLPFARPADKGEHYALSLKDQALARQFTQLQSIGVDSLKIEGRMKRPEYVASVVRAYVGLKRGIQPDLEKLQKVFSRDGFTEGYLLSRRDRTMFGTRTAQDRLTPSDALYQEIRENYRNEHPRFGLSFSLYVEPQQPVRLVATTDAHTATVEGEIPQLAKTRPLTVTHATTLLGKLGGTAFYADQIRCEITPDLAVSTATLNALRREAVSELSKKQTERSAIPFQEKRIVIPDRKYTESLHFQARFATVSQIPWEQLDLLRYFSLPLEQVHEHQAFPLLVAQQQKLLIEPMRVCFDDEQAQTDVLQSLCAQGYGNLLVSNPAHIQIGQKLGMTLFGTAFCNITNSYSLHEYASSGFVQSEVSFELTAKQMQRLPSSIPLGFIGYGYLPAMIVRNCPLKQQDGCGSCKGEGMLRDRKNASFFVRCTDRQTSEIFNPHPIWLADKQLDFHKMDFLTLYFTRESAAECAEILTAYQSGRPPNGAFTRGLYYRGTQQKQ